EAAGIVALEPELLLGVPALGDVGDRPEVAADRPGRVAQRNRPPGDPDDAPVGGATAELGRELLARGHPLAPAPDDARAIVAVDDARPRAVGCTGRREPGELAPAVVEKAHLAVCVELEDPDRGVRGERAEPFLAAAER